MQQVSSPPGESDDVGGRKAHLLALLDRARVNRGLEPESSDTTVTTGQSAKSDPVSFIKSETSPVPSASDCVQDPEGQMSTSKRPFGSQNSQSRTSEDDSVLIKQEDQNPVVYQSSVTNHKPPNTTKTTQKTQSSNGSASHSRTSSGSSGLPAEDEDVTVTTTADIRYMEPAARASDEHPRVAVLHTTPKPRTADLTGITRNVPRLQQLKPLQVPRNNQLSQPAQPQHEVKAPTRREIPPRAQPKQGKKNTASTTTNTSLKRLTSLTPDEYDDSELHGDFLHMMHILIPANATGALLEHRGEPIQSISQQADCTLSIREPEASPFKDDRLLRIYGKAKCISLAQQLVIAYIRAFRAEKRDPSYIDLTEEQLPVPVPATCITKATSVAVSSGKDSRKKAQLDITSPFTWMVEREEVGKMMGRQGVILASIRQDTGATIHVEEDVVPGTTERRVILSGTKDAIVGAVEAIKSKSGGRPEVAATVSNGRLGQYFAIPYHAAGCLIGPQGSTVKSITERSGARLQIPSAEDLPLGSVNRILHMQGTPKQTEHAQRIVGGKLRDYLSSTKSPKPIIPGSTGVKGDKVTVKALLPSRIAAFLLDRRGRLVREISEKSGAYTHFLAPHDEEQRICVFSGDLSNVLRAQRLVLQIVAGDAISSKHIVPPRKRKRAQRYEEEEEEMEVEEEDEMVDEQDYVEGDTTYYEDEVEDEYYDDEFAEEPQPLPRRHQIVRHRPLGRSRHEYDEHDHMYEDEDDGYEELEERPRQPLRRRPAPTRRREYYDAVDEYDHDDSMEYEAPRPRVPMRQTAVRRRPPATIRRSAYETDDYDYEYEDEDEGDDQLLLPPRKLIRRRPSSTQDDRRSAVVFLGRKVQMVAPAQSPRNGRPRAIRGDQRRTNGSARPRPKPARSGASSARGGRGRASATRGRGRGGDNKRRRQ